MKRVMKRLWKYLLAAIVLAGCCYVLANWIELQSYNQSPLKIHTFYKWDSPYHPSVLYLEQPVSGYHYWMAETPFPPKAKPYNDRWECPSIHASNDGIHWTEPIQNPITNLSDEEIENLDYYSDPHLVKTGPSTFECWYRLNRRHRNRDNNDEVMLMRQTTTDFITWSSPELLQSLLPSCDDNKGLGKMVVSPAVIYRDSCYQMWYVDSHSHAKRKVAFSTSADGKHWSDKHICTLRGAGINPWHIDVTILDNAYWLVIYDHSDLTLWCSSDGITFDYVKTLLKPSRISGSFYYGLYRSCLIKAEGKYNLYFSGYAGNSTYIGLMQGDTPESLEVVSVDGEPFCNFFEMLYPLCLNSFHQVKYSPLFYKRK